MNQVNIPGLPFISRTSHRHPVAQREPWSSGGYAENRCPAQATSRAGSRQEGSSSTGSIHITAQHLPLPTAANVNEWEFHNKYGIIHGWLCEICQDYIAHLKSFYSHPTCQKSQDGSKGLYEAFYRDGLKEGIGFGKSQVESLQAELIRVEEERRETSEKLSTRQIECTELRDKLRSLQTELADLQPTPAPTIIPPKVACDARANPQVAIQRPLHSSASRHSYSSPRCAGVSPSHSIPFGNKTVSTGSTDTENPKTNPRLEDPVEVWYDYYCTHRKSWPRGVRRDIRHRPILSDLRADRAVARFRPDIAVRPPEAPILHTLDPDSFPAPSPRNQFKNLIVDLFSQPGLYAKLLVQMNLLVSPLKTYSTYSGSFPMKMEDMVTFLAKSGVTPQTATSDFEPWAKNYREGVNESIPFTPSPVQSRPRRR